MVGRLSTGFSLCIRITANYRPELETNQWKAKFSNKYFRYYLINQDINLVEYQNETIILSNKLCCNNLWRVVWLHYFKLNTLFWELVEDKAVNTIILYNALNNLLLLAHVWSYFLWMLKAVIIQQFCIK